MDLERLRWWGWGTLDHSYPLDNRPNFWPMLSAWLELPDDLTERPPVSLDEIELRPHRLDSPVLASLKKLIGEDAVCVNKLTRVEHSLGKSYRDLVRVRAGELDSPPDAVIYPDDEGQVVDVLSWAADRDVAIIPFGGGSSVLGGVEPSPGDQIVISLDLARLDQLVALDTKSWTACIQAGATGPEVEEQLERRGFTLGHFPQSFEFSTLGGWVATRSAGQTSTGYGKIEDMVQSLRAVTPAGILETRDTPASAAGPSLLNAIVGSEGAYGVITEATMRVCRIPEVKDYRGFLFHTLEAGLETLRELMQHGPRPTIARLSDMEETVGFAALAHAHQGLRLLSDKAIDFYLTQKGHDLEGGSLFLLLGYEGTEQQVRARWKHATRICRDNGGLALGRAAGQSWTRDRFAQPYLRDTLLGVGVLVDTLETATSWSNLPSLYSRVKSALRATIQDTGGGPGHVMTHFSHIYEWGASLYTTFLGRAAPGQEIEQWWAIKRAATEAIIEGGGTLSHHHGVGRDHVEWLDQEVGRIGVTALRGLKRALDPSNIMNPGVLIG